MRRSVSIGASMALIAAAIVAASAGLAGAQDNPGRYVPPAGPPLSPYLDLFRARTSVVDNYHAFVRPRFQLRGRLQEQAGQIDTLQRDVQELRRPQVPSSGAAPTGIGGGFMNFSHYYTLPGRRR